MPVVDNFRSGQRQSGFSLVELMVSVLLGLVVVGAAVAVYLSMVFSSTDTVRSARLNYDMGSLLLFMTNDLRRAGYWGGVVAGADPLLNPFTSDDEDIQILTDWDGNGNACIVYSYDSDDDGALQDDERFGFRLNDNGSLDIRLGGTVLASCADADGTWERITVQDDSEVVQITDLQFSFLNLAADADGSDGAGPYPPQDQTSLCENVDDDVTAADPTPDCSGGIADAPAAGDALVTRRLVNVRMTGEMGRDSEISRSLVATVKVANDRLWVEP
ncbi:prepilin-type N-terminal cleavage/methylation domain-containing protein [Haliea sp. E1-2-M8]|uniref:prepilin-type N-terminal cleavage/methylation domain-containing protein n=1 Tax=Haliea sp. E1-2-M8 TaxID=3064706 RepID=UPI00271FFD5E|nr:prepilin-type N-terminal cleavage/methylation domain-containing protein [Haliea sp. E1-2-M8]MDO8864114.1 prepilin-type N-terminal cleavage/methylation domain-containing protein [Haliea sp. E1-2-M8]